MEDNCNWYYRTLLESSGLFTSLVFAPDIDLEDRSLPLWFDGEIMVGTLQSGASATVSAIPATGFIRSVDGKVQHFGREGEENFREIARREGIYTDSMLFLRRLGEPLKYGWTRWGFRESELPQVRIDGDMQLRLDVTGKKGERRISNLRFPDMVSLIGYLLNNLERIDPGSVGEALPQSVMNILREYED